MRNETISWLIRLIWGPSLKLSPQQHSQWANPESDKSTRMAVWLQVSIIRVCTYHRGQRTPDTYPPCRQEALRKRKREKCSEGSDHHLPNSQIKQVTPSRECRKWEECLFKGTKGATKDSSWTPEARK